MPSLTIENYVKTIYQICTRQGGEPATTGEIAIVLQVSPGTVTSMLKTLSESELATYAPYEGVRLTDAGKALALRVIRRKDCMCQLPWISVFTNVSLRTAFCVGRVLRGRHSGS